MRNQKFFIIFILLLIVLFIGFKTIFLESRGEQATAPSYTHPTYGYSLQIPQNWEQFDSRTETETVFTDPTGDLRFQIVVFSLKQEPPPDTKTPAPFNFNKIFEAEPGEEINVGASPIKKLGNITLDKCYGPQILFHDQGWTYSTLCTGTSHFMSISLKSEKAQLEEFEKYKSTYDTILDSFKFNNFSL